MRVELRLPVVEPESGRNPTVPRTPGAAGSMSVWQVVAKAVRDTITATVSARRAHCLRCGRTFRVYPREVDHAPTSQQVKWPAVIRDLLGFSYGAVALALEALAAYVCKTQVYEAVQPAARQVPGVEHREVFGGERTSPLAAEAARAPGRPSRRRRPAD